MSIHDISHFIIIIIMQICCQYTVDTNVVSINNNVDFIFITTELKSLGTETQNVEKWEKIKQISQNKMDKIRTIYLH